MTVYNATLDTQIDPDAPATSLLMYQMRDNPIAMFEGAAGAPRLQFNAMDGWFSTAGAVGSYVFAVGNSDTAFGATVAGSTLNPTSAMTDNSTTSGAMTTGFTQGAALTGTWRCMGTFDATVAATGGGNYGGATLWLRIA